MDVFTIRMHLNSSNKMKEANWNISYRFTDFYNIPLVTS